MLLPFVASCDNDNGGNEPGGSVEVTLPSMDFGQTMSRIQEIEADRGFTVTQTDGKHLTAVKTENGSEVKYVYAFDPVTDEYRYAKATYADAKGWTLVTKYLEKSAQMVKLGEANDVILYGVGLPFIAINKQKNELFVFNKSLSAMSWGRMNNLEDSNAAGLIVPYLGKYAPLELMQLFEQYHGNTLNVTLSKPGNGVYVYDVAANTKGYTRIKYWFDTATKSMLEEAAVFFDPEKRPTTAEVEKYMTYLGMTYTSQNDATDGSNIYFNYEEKYVAYLLMNKPSDTTQDFQPMIQFTFDDLTSQLPPLTVNFPEPITEFGEMTLDEAVEQYRGKDYFLNTADDGFGGALGIKVVTNSPDFPEILLMENDGKYIAAVLIPNDVKALRSPGVQSWLTAHGYTYDENSILPTYRRSDGKVMAQFDLNGDFTGGAPALAFQPNEL